MPTTLRMFVPAAIRAVMNHLTPRLEDEARVRLIQEVELNPLIPERIRVGERYDIGLTNPSYAKALINDGQILKSVPQVLTSDTDSGHFDIFRLQPVISTLNDPRRPNRLGQPHRECLINRVGYAA